MICRDEVHVVVREEHHLLASCPCTHCELERERRNREDPTNHLIKTLPVEAAYILGFISRRNPHGSVARDLMIRKQGGL